MEVRRLTFPLNIEKDEFPPLAMALGYFDGVHRGHAEVIAKAKSEAAEKGLQSAVMTFDPHPSVVLGRKEQHIQYITPLPDKIEILKARRY